MTNTYTFKELTLCDWTAVAKKRFRRVDTGELLGEIFAKYSINCGKLSAMMNDGRIEFLLRENDCEKYKVLFGNEFDADAKIFAEISYMVHE